MKDSAEFIIHRRSTGRNEMQATNLLPFCSDKNAEPIRSCESDLLTHRLGGNHTHTHMSTYLRHVIIPICLTPIESERFTVIIYLFSVKMLSFLASKIISLVRFSSSPKRNYSPAGRNVTTPHTLAKQRGRKKEEKGVTKNGHRSSSLCRHKASRSYETGSGSAKGSVQFFSPSPPPPAPSLLLSLGLVRARGSPNGASINFTAQCAAGTPGVICFPLLLRVAFFVFFFYQTHPVRG